MSKETGIDIQGSEFHPFNSQKILCHAKRMQGIVNEHYYPPIVLNLDVTGDCQYRCTHCHHRLKQIHDAQLPDLPERLANTLPQFLRHWEVEGERILGCCIVGSQGDPLLYPHLAKLLKELHFAGIEVGLVTNGFGFTNELIRCAAFYTKFIGFSMDAAHPETYAKIKQTKITSYDVVREHIAQLTREIKMNNLRNDVGWKILILSDSQREIYAGCEEAKNLGCRYVQIRPADLPKSEQEKIDIENVMDQIEHAICDFEIPGKFEIVGVRHKFTIDNKQILPDYCYLTPLTVTITSDGKAYACVDRRCDKDILLADCGSYGWTALSDVWGTPAHVDIIQHKINHDGKGPTCNIRCSNYGYDKYFRNYFVQDNVDWKLI